jgi:iron complex transport system substrate-binding protein
VPCHVPIASPSRAYRATAAARRTAVSCLAAIILLVACGAPPPPAAARPAARIVSLAPSSTEIVYALGAGDRLVGVCSACDRPAEVARVPRVGGYLSPSVEAVIAARPDLVIAVPSPGNREAVRAIERAGIRVLVVRDRRLDDLWTSIRDVADALGAPAAGAALADGVHRGLDDVARRVAGLPRRRVLVVVGHNPLIAVGGGSLQDELVEIAGGINVAGDAGEVWPKIAAELVVARAPEVIVDAAMGSDTAGAALFANLVTVPAVRDGRVVVLREDAYLRASPRVAVAARALAAAIHPEAFAG